MENGTSASLYGVWGNSGSDVFAVADEGMIVHYDGQRWSKMESGTSRNLLGIWGSSAHDVLVVGQVETILHYNGARWASIKKPQKKIGTYQMTRLEFSPDGKKLFGATGKQILTWNLS